MTIAPDFYTQRWESHKYNSHKEPTLFIDFPPEITQRLDERQIVERVNIFKERLI